jgi:hypothetical protein
LQMFMAGALDLLGVSIDMAAVLLVACEALAAVLMEKDCLRPTNVYGAWVMRGECEQREKFLSYLERRFWSLGCCVGVPVATQTDNMMSRIVNTCGSHARRRLRVCYTCG